MSLFDRHRPPTPPPADASKYSVENIHRLLDEIGVMRLRVKGARMKLLVSRVAWETQQHLDRLGPPPGRVVAELQEQLTMIRNVVSTYSEMQANPDVYASKGDMRQLLANGRNALCFYLDWLTAHSGTPDITGYVVDTKVLSTNFN